MVSETGKARCRYYSFARASEAVTPAPLTLSMSSRPAAASEPNLQKLAMARGQPGVFHGVSKPRDSRTRRLRSRRSPAARSA